MRSISALLVFYAVPIAALPLSLTNSTNGTVRTASNVGGTFVHLFEWSWDDVADECESFLGPNGYGAVQISPAMEDISGSQWWTRYQPVSYKLESRSGTRDQLASMVKRCNAAGVDIYADAVINHMAAGSGTGRSGSTFGGRAFQGLYSQGDFHHNQNDQSTNCGVTDYNDIHNVQYCDLVGLPDLCTGCSYVQQRLGEYLKDLASLGIKGFRIDAAKHQQTDELAGVLHQGPEGLYTFHEVISGAGEAVKPEMYFDIGQVTEFNYARQLAPLMQQEGSLQQLSNFGESSGLMPSEHAVVFMDNHDTQRGEAKLTYKDGDLYTLANVFMLAHPYGYPKVMSSYTFSDNDSGPPSSPVHSGSSVNCGQGQWVCEHRQPEIAAMVGFRKFVEPQSIGDFQTGQGNSGVAFSVHGTHVGFVIINRSGSDWSQTFQTALPAGQYQDALKSVSGTFTVGNDGKVTIQVPSMKAVALK